MKVLLLTDSDQGGGASIAARRLFFQLRTTSQIQVDFGVITKKTTDSINLLVQKKKLFETYLFRFLTRLVKFLTKKIIPQFRTTNPIKHSENKISLINVNDINRSEYDIIHLHWINNDMISIEDIARIKKPIVWTMHDFWPFSGAEHYPNILENDTRYAEGYSRYNKPKTTSGPDICRKTWERKKKAWRSIKFNFISPSNFEKEAFGKSALFKNGSSICNVIPNIVPENIFRKLDKNNLKEQYQIDPNKKVIGFGADYDITDKKSIKGSFLLIEALKKLPIELDYHFVIFGDASVAFQEAIKIPTFNAGFITNSHVLAGIYNICDVIVCPSLLENLPNICLEALFCGIPVTAFNTGGVPDIVEHKKTGYLAKCFDPEDLCNGIAYCTNNYDELSQNSLKKAKTEFDNDTIVKKHIELYKSII